MRTPVRLTRVLLMRIALCLLPLPCAAATLAAYDPLYVADGAGAVRHHTQDTVVDDRQRRRTIQVLIYLPVQPSRSPVVLFSHGLGGSRHCCSYVGAHWAGRGYVVVFMQHQGSDSALWQGQAPTAAGEALRGAAQGRNLILRVGDLAAVLDALERWDRTPGHPLCGRLDLQRVGIGGHSFGAKTAQAVSGENMAIGGTAWTDRRIDAALILSPSQAQRRSPAESFGAVRIPWMLMTGTADDSPIGSATPASRQAVYPALPPGAKYELVLNGAEHHAFTDHPPRRGQAPRDPRHHRTILALGTAFWDAYLRGDAAARAWLDGTGARAAMAPADRWQRK